MLFLPFALSRHLSFSLLFFLPYLFSPFLLCSSAQTRLWPSQWRVRLWDLRAEKCLEDLPVWEQVEPNERIQFPYLLPVVSGDGKLNLTGALNLVLNAAGINLCSALQTSNSYSSSVLSLVAGSVCSSALTYFSVSLPMPHAAGPDKGRIPLWVLAALLPLLALWLGVCCCWLRFFGCPPLWNLLGSDFSVFFKWQHLKGKEVATKQLIKGIDGGKEDRCLLTPLSAVNSL